MGFAKDRWRIAAKATQLAVSSHARVSPELYATAAASFSSVVGDNNLQKALRKLRILLADEDVELPTEASDTLVDIAKMLELACVETHRDPAGNDDVDWAAMGSGSGMQEVGDWLRAELLPSAVSRKSSLSPSIGHATPRTPGASVAKGPVGELIGAAAAGERERVKELLGVAGVDVNGSDENQRTACHAAASEGHLDLLRYLVDVAGASVGVTDHWGGTPLDDALRSGHTEAAEFLVSKGGRKGRVATAEVDAIELCHAAANGDVGTLRTVVGQHGVDALRLADYDQRTALHLAAAHGHLETVQYLIEEVRPRRRPPLCARACRLLHAHPPFLPPSHPSTRLHLPSPSLPLRLPPAPTCMCMGTCVCACSSEPMAYTHLAHARARHALLARAGRPGAVAVRPVGARAHRRRAPRHSW